MKCSRNALLRLMFAVMSFTAAGCTSGIQSRFSLFEKADAVGECSGGACEVASAQESRSDQTSSEFFAQMNHEKAVAKRPTGPDSLFADFR